ncbi:dentin sialophosphoprotein [Amborella trichopoda]|uniref:Tudor domain-containing protein n=1 Tax=Amborella trichopoda TaxID=13333 RepID=U5CZ75_AMBTC|nr:dentin sialophosphoprotein [Amborella trichopoda]ERN18641.1 hypothetical protein AMTR_s00065p00174980 [Amborella trichopoda]|eukprot:XP_006857174.1 dentin sialophosphoprotein [Amborella trichopoda]
MTTTEHELEEQLLEAGKKLEKLPSDPSELLPLLEKVEFCLSRAEQSPSKSMSDALVPSTNALVTSELLKHPDKTIRVVVASCISEITRITAPEAPYGDDLMKEVFQMIVASFEDLSDKSSPSFNRRVSILETLAKVRSCVVMLDLECDALIVEMFQHFLETIREDHPENVFTSMATVMTLVLEESEDISFELISALLNCLMKIKQNASSFASKLAKKVISNCRGKLDPYMDKALEELGISSAEFTEVMEQPSKVPNSSDQNLTDECKKSESSGTLEPPPAPHPGPEKQEGEPAHHEETGVVDITSKDKMSNGTAKLTEEDTPVDTEVPKLKADRSHRGTSSTTKNKKETLDPRKSTELESPRSQTTEKKRGRKPSILSPSSDASEDTRFANEKEDVEPSKRKRQRQSKGSENAPSDAPQGKEAAASSVTVKKPQLPSPSRSNNETADVPSPATEALPSEMARPTRRRSKVSQKDDNKLESDVSVTPGEAKETSTVDHGGDKSKLPKDPVDKAPKMKSKAESEGDAHPVVKTSKRSNKKGNASKKESNDKSSEEKKPAGDSSSKKLDSASKSTTESASKERTQSDAPKTAKRKSNEKDVTPAVHGEKDIDESLVGSRIKVWWPRDKQFYEGIVQSFDSEKKKHTVAYTDGDVEVLKLEKERWELVEADAEPEAGPATAVTSLDASPVTPPRKRSKKNAGSSVKEVKTEAPVKRTESSSGKQRGGASRSGEKSNTNGSSSAKGKPGSSNKKPEAIDSATRKVTTPINSAIKKQESNNSNTKKPAIENSESKKPGRKKGSGSAIKQESNSSDKKQEGSSSNKKDIDSTDKKQESNSSTKKQESTLVTKKQESASATKKQESTSATKKQESTSATKKQESTSATKKQESVPKSSGKKRQRKA